MKNYIDEKGNYINIENLSLKQIYDRGFKDGYKQAIIDGKTNFSRPQGEWKLDDTEQFCYCSNCEDTYYPRPLDPSWYYCPHCGADMRGAE